MAPPIRVAMIGLSASGESVTSWASIAHLPYLLSERGQAKYKIVALLNSSVEAAKKAIETYKLPAETRAYGDPAALAADKDVDLVVCNTRVDTHYDAIYPSLVAGKDVYTEWPLAETAEKARELATLAKKSGSKTVVGLQGRLTPLTLKVKELLEQGRIGKVLSSEVRASIGITQLGWPHRFGYFFKREIGGNPYTISFAHSKYLVLLFLTYPPANNTTTNNQPQQSTSSNPSSAKQPPQKATSSSNPPSAKSSTWQIPPPPSPPSHPTSPT